MVFKKYLKLTKKILTHAITHETCVYTLKSKWIGVNAKFEKNITITIELSLTIQYLNPL